MSKDKCPECGAEIRSNWSCVSAPSAIGGSVLMSTIIPGKNPNLPYTLRYYHDGRQREKTFRTKREAKDFQAKFEHDSRENIFVDPRESAVKFRDASAQWVSRLTGAESSKRVYRNALGPPQR